MAVAACGGTLNAGWNLADDASLGDSGDPDRLSSDGGVIADAVSLDASDGALTEAGTPSRGLLPIDERNPVILVNDGWSDNWHGEFAALLSSKGTPSLVGIVVGATDYWSDLNANLDGWNRFVTAARASGLARVPDVTAGASRPLAQPANGTIESTVSIGSPGARLIVDVSRKLSVPDRPIIVLSGSQLTDVADAYLLDRNVADRVIVLASLGLYKAPRGIMSGPNGDLDPWADWIVAQRFRYIQMSVDYDQSKDVTVDDVPNLPHNALGEWMAAKQSGLSSLTTASDQMTVLAAALTSFAVTAQRCSPDTSAGFNSPPGQGPPLVPNASGRALLVTEVRAALGRSRLWELLLDPKTFGP